MNDSLQRCSVMLTYVIFHNKSKDIKLFNNETVQTDNQMEHFSFGDKHLLSFKVAMFLTCPLRTQSVHVSVSFTSIHVQISVQSWTFCPLADTM